MNLTHIKYRIFILFLLAIGFTNPSDMHFVHEPHVLQAINISHANSHSIHSNDAKWLPSQQTYYNEIVKTRGISPHYTIEHYKHYFDACGFTESQILNYDRLYTSDEFVKLAKTYPDYENTINQLHKKLNNLTSFKKFLSTLSGSYYPGLKKRIQFLYDEINTKRMISTFHECISEYKILDSIYRTYIPSLSLAIEKRLKIYNDMCNANITAHKTKIYDLNNNIKQLLHNHGHDENQFNQCTGNPLQLALHNESLNILERISSLPAHSALHDHQEALIDYSASIVAYNHVGLTDKAMYIADFCWTLIDYGQAIIEGAVLGLYSAASDIIENPIEATASIIAGRQILAYQLCKIIYNVADIGLTAIVDVCQAKEKWNNYSEPLNNIITAIQNKKMSLRDAIENGTALAVGWKAQSKLLSGLGKFCTSIKQKSVHFAQNNPLLSPQEYLATPDGLLLKATSQSTRLKQSGQLSTTINVKNSVENKVANHKSIKRLIKDAKLPTKGKLWYVPPKKLHISDGLPRTRWHDKRTGFIDRFDNVWLRGKSRTIGQDFEWDVQLSPQGQSKVGWMTRDNSHLNVSLNGRVTHK
ncbi:MAG TPA: polymorphic toxin type 17 domain-containing protein [Candidatus Babeliales bacterium]|nr:polymorphic toxin type 17 domain-containing protein [Candidatus Babeliales bacterium]